MNKDTLKVRLLVHKFTPSYKLSPGDIVEVIYIKGKLHMVNLPVLTLGEDEYEAILDDDQCYRFLRGLSGK